MNNELRNLYRSILPQKPPLLKTANFSNLLASSHKYISLKSMQLRWPSTTSPRETILSVHCFHRICAYRHASTSAKNGFLTASVTRGRDLQSHACGQSMNNRVKTYQHQIMLARVAPNRALQEAPIKQNPRQDSYVPLTATLLWWARRMLKKVWLSQSKKYQERLRQVQRVLMSMDWAIY